MNYVTSSLLILLLPLVVFIILGIWGRRYISKAAGGLATLIMGVVALLCLYIAGQYFFVSGQTNGVYQPIIAVQLPWLSFGYKQLSIDVGIMLDSISVMMLVVISVVSFMVHLFSLGYMKGAERYATYYAFLALFTFSMLGLVVSVNLFAMYMFWELVGVSSYLLIGFYFTKPSAVAASKMAFIVTRFADFGFLIGILILGIQAGTLDFNMLLAHVTNPQSEAFLNLAAPGLLGISLLSWALALVFMGGAGKSAMFPLHIWLPHAMEGPTPVSALIHAATMVVAGVYLVARLFPIFHLAAGVMHLITWVGVFSALFAALIAITQTDIKRVLAYSTMSQIGYMMFALGVSGYGAQEGLGYTGSMFHLFTHAFFKSLLFLGAGAVIHAVHSNEVSQMGGLRKTMPLTHICFLIACLAIAGMPPFAGFFSKEEILLAAWQQNKMVYAIALFTAGLTAFYMFRLYFLIFWHQPSQYHVAHGEGTLSMKLPLVLLAICSIGAGFVPFSKYVSANGQPWQGNLHLAFSVAPVLLTLLGIALAAYLYKNYNHKAAAWRTAWGRGYQWAYHKFYIDELYGWFTQRIAFGILGRTAARADKKVVDGAVNKTGRLTAHLANAIKGWQSGKVQQYALYFMGGVIVLAAWLVFMK